ncbi:MAG: hypothetical protein M5U26_08435 [Planctomycetota bacterium]|nr:hypothetical protein [Planctomycetota bacterium]
MSRFDRLGEAAARASLNVARRAGVQVSFTHRDEDPVTLWAQVLSNRVELVRRGLVDVALRVLTLEIATGQTGFEAPSGEPEPVTPGDVVTYQSRAHAVLEPIGKNAQGTVYLLRCVEEKELGRG